MRVIDCFMQKIRETNEGFTVVVGDSKYLFTQIRMGSAYLVYGTNIYKRTIPEISEKLELMAIKTEDMVYIMSPYSFDLWESRGDATLPGGSMNIRDKYSEVNEYVANTVFPRWIKDIPESKLDEDERVGLRYAARAFMLTGSDKGLIGRAPSCNQIFDEGDVIQILCGLDAEAEALRRLEADRDSYAYVKARNRIRNEWLDSDGVVLPYEKAIADGLHIVDAKVVTVEFINNDGKTASTKMKPQRIIQAMLEGAGFYFSHWDFCNGAAAERMFDELNAEDRWVDQNSGKQRLSVRDINRIIYGKKVLYARKEFAEAVTEGDS